MATNWDDDMVIEFDAPADSRWAGQRDALKSSRNCVKDTVASLKDAGITGIQVSADPGQNIYNSHINRKAAQRARGW